MDDTDELIPDYMNEALFNDDQFSDDKNNNFKYVRNNLHLNPLKRSDLLKEFRCQAWNSDLVEPIFSTVRLDMIC